MCSVEQNMTQAYHARRVTFLRHDLFAYPSYRSSHRRCSVKTGVLKNFAIFAGKHLYWILFLNKLQDFTPALLFHVIIVKFLTTPFFKSICERLLLNTTANLIDVISHNEQS